MNLYETIVVEIPAGESESSVIDVREYSSAIVYMPSVWTSAALSIKSCPTSGGTFLSVVDKTGDEVSDTVVADTAHVYSLDLTPFSFVKFLSGVQATPVAQVGTAGVRTYPITTNAVAGDTVTILGQTFTAVSADAGSDEFAVGVDATATATALKTALNANEVISALYTATNSAGTVTLTEKLADGNTPPSATKTGTIVIGAGTSTTSVSGTRTLIVGLQA